MTKYQHSLGHSLNCGKLLELDSIPIKITYTMWPLKYTLTVPVFPVFARSTTLGLVVKICKNKLVLLITGLDYWTGTLDWTTRLTYFWFFHILRWVYTFTGLDYWAGTLDWTTGLTFFGFYTCCGWFNHFTGYRELKQKQSCKDLSTSIALTHTAHV